MAWPAAIYISLAVAWLFHEVASMMTVLTDGGSGLPFRSGTFSLIGVGLGGASHDPALVALNILLTMPVFAAAIRRGARVALAAFVAALLAVAVGLWAQPGTFVAGRIFAWLLAIGSVGAVALGAGALQARRADRHR